ncbi:ABC transporter permease [Calycomorphotria hydatis]|uniref:Oligopeptide transport system permease protein OppC n=1 Tax=Calycomorphotria hydatis TaxID=2528027 RepID=A0A517T5V4_9PLAN|nr:ABC transporter permease [Calycomorphotria hydatis]QDT63749.1 Oligopeptide transport system permease protein OppC [Calycomorphotria hydatis]
MAEADDNKAAKQPEKGRSQSALIWKGFCQRKLAVISTCVIIVLVTISIFAPIIANDKPLAYRGMNRYAYNDGLRNIRALLGTFRTADRDDFSAEDTFDNIESQFDRITGTVDKDSREKLIQFRVEIHAAVFPEISQTKLNQLRRQVRTDFGPDNIQLNSRWFFPAIMSLGWADLFFITLNIGALKLIFFSLTGLIGPTLRKRMLWLTLIAPIIIAGAWWALVPDRLDSTPYKQGRLADASDADSAPVIFETVIWPPIPYALDEDNLDRKFAAPFWWPEEKDSEEISSSAEPGPWEGVHWLGTDKIGRDVMSRMIWGGRVSLAVGIVAVGIYVTIGVIVGAIAGYFRGWTDVILSRIIEIVIVFPSFFLILTIVAMIGPSIWNIMVVIGLTGWTGVARLVRGEFLRLAGQEFVMAGRALGYSAPRIIFKHVLPNAIAPVLVAATFGVAGAILTESALSFLGLGITIPKPSWGGILAEGRDYIRIAPWLIYFPGFAIFVTITCYNIVGDALRDASDPRLRGSR